MSRLLIKTAKEIDSPCHPEAPGFTSELEKLIREIETFPYQKSFAIRTVGASKAMTTLEATIENIFATRRITRYDQQLLMQLFSQSGLSSTDKHCIDRVYEALSRGLLKVVD